MHKSELGNFKKKFVRMIERIIFLM